MLRRYFAAVTTSILALALTAPAQAQTQSPAPSNDDGWVPPKIALVLDASGSMAESDVDGGNRMDAAKKAANGMLEDLDDDVELGLIAYGAEISDGDPDNYERGCQDIKVLRSVGPLDRDTISQEIDDLEATGYTPIGNSLKKAAKELGDEGPRSIVLVSDGIDTCAPPEVCDVAEDLGADGVDLAVHTVGFRVNDDAQSELECIAEATGGTYSSADNSNELGTTLSALAQRVGQAYEAGGTEITLGKDRDSGKYLGEGNYQTQMSGPTVTSKEGPAGWFKLNIPEGYRAHVSATVVDPSMEEFVQRLGGGRDSFSVDVEAENASCNQTGSSDWESTTLGREAPSASILRVTPKESCNPSDWNLEVKRTGSAYEDELPVELVIGLEPIAPEDQIGPEDNHPYDSEKDDVPELDDDYPVTDLAGGTSYSSATDIEPGTYSGSLVPGETRIYKMPMDWGQRPVAKAVFNARNADERRAAKLEVANPLRGKAGVEMSISLKDDAEVSAENRNAYWPIYSNSDGVGTGSSMAFQRDAAYIGDWFVMVTLDGGEDNGKASVEEEYELTVLREGDVIDGPEWSVPTNDGPEPSDEPIAPLVGPSASTDDYQSDDAENSGSDGANSDGGDNAEGAENAQAAESDEIFGLSTPVAIGAAVVLGLLVVVGLGIVIAIATRRKH